MGRILTQKDVEAAVRGGSIYAAGGGGWADHGRMLGTAAVSFVVRVGAGRRNPSRVISVPEARMSRQFTPAFAE